MVSVKISNSLDRQLYTSITFSTDDDRKHNGCCTRAYRYGYLITKKKISGKIVLCF